MWVATRRRRPSRGCRRRLATPLDRVDQVPTAEALERHVPPLGEPAPSARHDAGRDGFGDEDLLGIRVRADSRGEDDRPTVDVCRLPDDRAAVDPHSHAQRRIEERVRRGQAALDRDRAVDGGGDVIERDHESIAQDVDDRAAVPGDVRSHERVVTPQDLEPCVVAEALQQRSRTDDVREQQRGRRPV